MTSQDNITIGQRFGCLVVTVKYFRCVHQPRQMYGCSCDCGQHKTASEMSLMSGQTVHCGCNMQSSKIIDPMVASRGELHLLRSIHSPLLCALVGLFSPMPRRTSKGRMQKFMVDV